MVKNVDERIARIKQQREALAQRLNALEQKSKSEARKRDTRRKIIVGGAIIAQMEKVADFAATSFAHILDASVGRQNDREAIADLLGAAPGVASAAAPEKSGVAPAPAHARMRSGMNSARPDVSGVAPLGRIYTLSASPQPPRPPAPPFPPANTARTARRSSRFRYRQSFPLAWTKKRIGARRRATF